MIRRASFILRRLRNDARGATAIEFAFVGPLFFVLCFAMLDLTHQLYLKSTLQGEVFKAGRDSGLQSGVASATAIDNKVRDMMLKVAPGTTFVFQRKAFAEFSNAGSPEPFVDANSNGVRNTGECYSDINASGTWDVDSSRNGQGAASQAVVYTVTATFPHLFPVASLFGVSPTQVVKSSTVLRNQPYAAETIPVIRCT